MVVVERCRDVGVGEVRGAGVMPAWQAAVMSLCVMTRFADRWRVVPR